MPDVILPVLDEEDALPWVLQRMPEGFRAIVVDNGSTDASAAVARDHGALVVPEPARGFGAACFAGLNAATSDIVCFMDGDGSLDPLSLPVVAGLVERGDADLVLGRRIPDRGAWHLHSKLANRVLAWELRRRSGARVHDLGPMRGARREALLALGIQDRRFGWPLEMVLRAAREGWTITEVPIAYHARRGGQSKVTGTLKGTVRAIGDMGRVLR